MTTYQIEQRITPIVNRYQVFRDDGPGGPGGLVVFAQQKRLALRERITLFTDESQTDVVATIQARSVMDLGARYDVADARGAPLAVIGKAFGASLLRSTWHVFAPGNEQEPLLTVTERSTAIAVVRRVWELIPFAEMIPVPFLFHFDFRATDDGAIVATHDKTTVVRDNYRLEINDPRGLDDTVFIAVGIMLDALQGR